MWSLKTCFLEHRRPSTTASEVSNNIYVEFPGHFVDLDNVRILDRDSRWFEQWVKEAVHIKANKPSLNKDRVRYKLSGVYETVIRSEVRKIDAWFSQLHHSLADKDGVPSENSEVGINFVFGSKSFIGPISHQSASLDLSVTCTTASLINGHGWKFDPTQRLSSLVFILLCGWACISVLKC